jgi:hypothetical protein
MGVRPVRIDERGRIFELSGERFSLPGLEPADVLAGLADAQAGRIRSLKAIREGRAGRRRPGGPTARESAPGVCNSTRLDWAPRSGVGRPMNYRRSDPHRHRGDNRGVLKPSLSGGGRGRRDRSGVEAPHPRPALIRGRRETLVGHPASAVLVARRRAESPPGSLGGHGICADPSAERFRSPSGHLGGESLRSHPSPAGFNASVATPVRPRHSRFQTLAQIQSACPFASRHEGQPTSPRASRRTNL